MSQEAQIARLRAQAARSYKETLQSDLVIEIGSGNRVNNELARVKMEKAGQWTEEAIRAMGLNLTHTIIQRQVSMGNQVEAIYYDNSLWIDPLAYQRTIDVIFQSGENVRHIMDLVEASIDKRVPNTLYQWKAYTRPEGPTDPAKLNQEINTAGSPVHLSFGDTLYLVPLRTMGSGPDATYANILFLRGRGTDASGKVKKQGVRRPTGMFAGTVRDVRRAAKASGVHVRATLTNIKSYVDETRLYPPYSSNPGDRLSDRISPWTGKPIYVQGTWGIQLKLLRGRTPRR